MSYDFTKAKEDKLTKPRDLAWDNWATFEKVGDSAQGYIRDVFHREAEGDFKEQRGITLEQPDGTFINVGIKNIDFVLSKTNDLRLGDPLTIELEKETPHQQKGYSPIKVFGFYGKNLPETEGQKTVRQLHDEDRGIDSEAEQKANEVFENGKPAAEAKSEAAPVADSTPAKTAADVPFPSPSDSPQEAAPVATEEKTTEPPVVPAA